MLRNENGFTVFELLASVSMLGLVCTLLYVTGHFIAKFW